MATFRCNPARSAIDGGPTDDEIAAAVAAVALYTGATQSSKDPAEIRGWVRAARIEALGQVHTTRRWSEVWQKSR